MSTSIKLCSLGDDVISLLVENRENEIKKIIKNNCKGENFEDRTPDLLFVIYTIIILIFDATFIDKFVQYKLGTLFFILNIVLFALGCFLLFYVAIKITNKKEIIAKNALENILKNGTQRLVKKIMSDKGITNEPFCFYFNNKEILRYLKVCEFNNKDKEKIIERLNEYISNEEIVNICEKNNLENILNPNKNINSFFEIYKFILNLSSLMHEKENKACKSQY